LTPRPDRALPIVSDTSSLSAERSDGRFSGEAATVRSAVEAAAGCDGAQVLDRRGLALTIH
jgi:hypothetical protein